MAFLKVYFLLVSNFGSDWHLTQGRANANITNKTSLTENKRNLPNAKENKIYKDSQPNQHINSRKQGITLQKQFSPTGSLNKVT